MLARVSLWVNLDDNRLGPMQKLRIFGRLVLALIFLWTPAYAQTSVPEAAQTTSEQIETAGQAVVEMVSPPGEVAVPKTPNMDTVDPALLEALEEAYEARRQADADIADIVRQQMDTAAGQSDKFESDPSAKPSLIPRNAEELKALLRQIGDKLLGWLTSVKFLAQVGAIVLAYLMSPLLARLVRKKIFLFNSAPGAEVKFKVIRDYIFRIGALLRPIWLVGLLILFGVILKAVPAAGETWLVKITQSLAVVFLLYKAIKEFISNDLFQTVAIWTVIPLALIMVFGYYDDLIAWLDSISVMEMGGKPITLMTIILLVIFGSIFFKLGNIANAKGQTAIRSQEGLDVATQEVVAKIFQIILFTLVFVMVLGAAKVPLSGLVVIFSALSLGIGLGLQPIAANFVSGMIILFDRSVRTGDYVVLPDGQEGFVEAINMRNTVVETTDGKDIMVPNTKFTEDAYENWTHKDPRQRYEVHFTVGYDTDLDILEDLIIPEFLKHPSVLTEPEMPDLEFREFGEYGAKMAVEFWCSGIDDGENKFTSDLNFIVWRLLRDNKIQIPFPQLVVHKN